MKIDVRHLNGEVSDAMHEFAHRRIVHAVQPFEGAISSVDANVVDAEGAGGDTQCKVNVRLSSSGRPVTTAGKGVDAYAAILSATAHLRESVAEALGEERRIEESADSRSAALQQPAMTASVVGDDIVVTAMDRDRLKGLIQARRDARDREAAQALADELDRARIVSSESVAGNVVTMNSRIMFEDESTGEKREICLVYPRDSDPAQGRVSVFAPVGAALLGLATGQTIDWPLPQGQLKRYRVVKIMYQPEAAGHHTL